MHCEKKALFSEFTEDPFMAELDLDLEKSEKYDFLLIFPIFTQGI